MKQEALSFNRLNRFARITIETQRRFSEGTIGFFLFLHYLPNIVEFLRPFSDGLEVFESAGFVDNQTDS